MAFPIPNATATSNDFEFAALNEARNYRKALISEFMPFLRGNLIEIGAGIGQTTALLAGMRQISRLISIEPDAAFAERFRTTHPAVEFIEGTIEKVPNGTEWDAILSVNVLEHIAEDEAELARYARVLAARQGALCLLVPARPEIYAPIDRDFGHYRRYTRSQLSEQLRAAGFKLERLIYFNCAGYFAWWFNFCVLKKRSFEIGKVRAYDRVIFPIVHAFETSVMRPPFGQSLLAVARAQASAAR